MGFPRVSVQFLASTLHWIGILAYGGVLVVFALLLPLGGRLRGLQPWHLDRVFRACGPISGLGLGTLLVGGFLRLWLVRGSFSWNLDILLAKHLVLFVLWVSYTILEIWTLEPLRRLDSGDTPSDVSGYLSARCRVVRHVQVNAALLLLVLFLGLAG